MFPPFTACPTNFIMPGLDRILRGVLKYRADLKPQMVKQFEKIKDNPEPQCVMFCCIDSRVIITRVLQTDVGDMFLVRNAGNLVPPGDCVNAAAISTEPGALELGCVINGIRHVVVCGHSDCKAMGLLYSVKDSLAEPTTSPLQMWVKRYGAPSIEKYNNLKASGESGGGPLVFRAEEPTKRFEAYIDPEDKFKDLDKLSQINTLQQLENIASHQFLHDKLQKNEVRLHAMWFDVCTGDFYMFNREKKKFVEITEESFNDLIKDGESCAGQ